MTTKMKTEDSLYTNIHLSLPAQKVDAKQNALSRLCMAMLCNIFNVDSLWDTVCVSGPQNPLPKLLSLQLTRSRSSAANYSYLHCMQEVIYQHTLIFLWVLGRYSYEVPVEEKLFLCHKQPKKARLQAWQFIFGKYIRVLFLRIKRPQLSLWV